MKTACVLLSVWVVGALPAWAGDEAPLGAPAVTFRPVGDAAPSDQTWLSQRAWRVQFGADAEPLAAQQERVDDATRLSADAAVAAAQQQPARRRPVAITYSDGYLLRAKIHKFASVATLPMFGAQYILGEKLNEGGASESVRATHAGIATGMVGLFGLNTVTGVWNLWEARKDPNGRGRRILHSLLMLGADGGFAATGLLAPTNDGGGNRGLHRTVAITSMGVATAGYLLMLLGN